MSCPNTLEIRQLAFERSNHFLFRDINRTLQAGEVLQVVGENGSGKSTFLRLLAGLIPAEKNTLLWGQQCIQSQRSAYQQQLNYLGHQNGLRAALTVKENLESYAALQARTTDQLDSVIDKMGLQTLTLRPAAQLSAGQRRRLALARLLLVEQPLWIVDEPATALDKTGQQLFADMLTHHLSQGGIAVITSHHEFFNNAQTLQLGA